jgi:hypothetical protein
MELGSQLGPQNRSIYPSIQTTSRELKVYLHSHPTPHNTLMGNHKMEHHHP